MKVFISFCSSNITCSSSAIALQPVVDAYVYLICNLQSCPHCAILCSICAHDRGCYLNISAARYWVLVYDTQPACNSASPRVSFCHGPLLHKEFLIGLIKLGRCTTFAQRKRNMKTPIIFQKRPRFQVEGLCAPKPR